MGGHPGADIHPQGGIDEPVAGVRRHHREGRCPASPAAGRATPRAEIAVVHLGFGGYLHLRALQEDHSGLDRLGKVSPHVAAQAGTEASNPPRRPNADG